MLSRVIICGIYKRKTKNLMHEAFLNYFKKTMNEKFNAKNKFLSKAIKRSK